jgi:hypothetical protein
MMKTGHLADAPMAARYTQSASKMLGFDVTFAGWRNLSTGAKYPTFTVDTAARLQMAQRMGLSVSLNLLK